MSRDKKTAGQPLQPDFNGAAVIDDRGNEIAITEDMVRRAINALDSGAYPEYENSNYNSGNRKTQFARG